MNYRIYFSSGQTLTISEERFERLRGLYQVSTKKQYSTEYPPIKSGPTPLIVRESTDSDYINLANVDYIIPEPEGSSDIIKSPTPETIKEAERRKREEIIKDPKKVLTDIQNEEMSES